MEEKEMYAKYALQAYNKVKECVDKMLSYDSLEDIENTTIITGLVANFDELKYNAKESEEFKKSSELIRSIAKKFPTLESWCKNIINDFSDKPVMYWKNVLEEENKSQKEDNSVFHIWGAKINLDKTNELIVKDNVKIVVNAQMIKDLIDKDYIFGTEEYMSIEIPYDLFIGQDKYSFVYRTNGNSSNDDKCPYLVILSNFKKDDDGSRVVVFDILEKVVI